MNFGGQDTIFYHRVDGVLRQALKIWVTNRTGKPQSGAITVYASNRQGINYEPVSTPLPVISPGRKSYTVFAPVVYPNFGSMISYGAAKHNPVRARIELKVGAETTTKTITIGRWRPWTIYVCQDVCTDFTWGYKEGETIDLSVNLTKAHLKAIKDTEKEPFESQNRWNINQAMEAIWFMERESREKANELFEREKDGHICISPIYNSCLTGIMTTEQAIRSLYPARRLERDYGVDLSTAEHIEVPSIAWGMATIFAGAGIEYFVKGWLDFMAPWCSQRDDIPIFYWEGPDGSKVLTASDKGASLRASYAQARFLFKPYKEAVKELHEWWIPHFENHTEYPYDTFILLGSHGDIGKQSARQMRRLVSNVIRYNSEPCEYPKIVNAKWRFFFRHIEDFVKKNGTSIPVLKGDFGISWDEWPAHLAAVFSEVRRGLNSFITAEKLLALASVLEPGLYAGCLDNMKCAQMRMEQIAEHPWNGSYPQEKVDAFHRKHMWQEELNEIADEVIEKSLEAICRHIATETERTLVVFNPLSWERTDIVTIEGLGRTSFALKDDSTAEEVPSDLVLKEEEAALSFIAEKVPALGYKTYTFSKGKQAGVKFEREPPVKTKGNVIENDFYRVEVDERTGGLRSLFDKKRKVQLVDAKSQYKVNQYLYLSEGKEHSPAHVKISPGYHGQVSGSLVIESSTLRSKIRTVVTLYSDLDRIDIANEVEKTPSSEPQEIHFVFPFNVPDRVYHYESTAAIVKPGLWQYGGTQLRGSGQTSHACQTFVDVSNEEYGVTLSQIDSYLLQFGHRTTFEVSEYPDPSNSTVFSVVMLNKCPEMLPDQGGIANFVFRYSIKGHLGRFEASEAVRFGWERNNGLIARVPNPGKNPDLPNRSQSFLSCKQENVVLTSLKVSEEGIANGIILRVWETEGKDTVATFDVSALGATSAVKTDLLERDEERLEVTESKLSVSVPGHGIAAARLLLHH